MAKIKFTKGELKRQRDALKQFKRYLPTLQLKKQQLQLEILQQNAALAEKEQSFAKKKQAIIHWAGLLDDPQAPEPKLNFKLKKINTRLKNIAGVDIPIFETAEFEEADYDLFAAPLWIDLAGEYFKEIIALNIAIAKVREGIAVLRRELQVTTQRVNLFEKIKIPAAEENIRLIKIYIGDQMANAVGRSKIAKKKIEELILEEAAA